MPTSNELQQICDRLSQAAGEFKQHAITLANLQREIQAARGELASLQAQIAEGKTLAGQIDEVSQHLRTKRAELAELSAEIARKHALHGQVDSDLRDLRKRISGDPTHV